MEVTKFQAESGLWQLGNELLDDNLNIPGKKKFVTWEA